MPLTGRLGTIDSRPSNISLGDDVVASLIQSVSDSIAFVQDVVASTKQFSLSDPITFAQSASAVADRVASASSTLALTDTMLTAYAESISDPITFVQSAVGGLVRVLSVSQAIAFTQDTINNIKNASASSTLAFVQSVDEQGPIYQTVTHFIPFADSPGGDLSVINLAVASPIVFAQSVGRVLAQSISQSIAFTDTGKQFTGGFDTITFAQAVVAARGGDPVTALSIVDVASAQLIATRSLPDAVSFVQGVTFILDRGCTEKLYSPFVGTGDPSYTSPPTTSPTFGQATLTLTYPYVSPTSTLALRNPEFGDRNVLTFNRINRETRGGTLIVFADPNWPKIQKLTVTLTGLKQQQVDDLQSFFDASLGQEIGLLDHLNRQWRGIITTPDAEIVENSRNNRGVSFEFEGSLV